MKILVTGATGFIGSTLVRKLHNQGFDFDCLDAEWSNHNNILEWSKNNIKADVRTFKANKEYDVVVHLAGKISVEESVSKPYLYYDHNINGTHNMLMQYPNSHFIFASTAACFDLDNPYAISKLACEDVIKAESKSYTIFRFFNLAGSDGLNIPIGEMTSLVACAAQAALGIIPALQVYGTDYSTPDGTGIRDYIHVEDLTQAIINTIKAGPQNTPYESLGTTTGFSVLEVTEVMKKVTGVDFPVQLAPRRAGDSDSDVLAVKKYKHLDLAHSLEDMCLSTYNVLKQKSKKN